MESSKEMAKIRKVSHSIYFVMKVMFGICIVGAILCVLFLIVGSALPEKLFVIQDGSTGGFSLTMDGLVHYRVDEALYTGVSTKPIMRAISFMAALIFLGLSLLFKQVVGLLSTIENNEPFSESNVKRLTNIGLIFIIGAFLYRAAGFFVASAIIKTFHIENLHLVYNIEFPMILFGFMSLVLAGVFRYGNFLQKEYDSIL